MENCGEKSVILEIHSVLMRFSGSISAKLDAKGRVFLPSVYRKLLPDADMELVLKRDTYQSCLVIYPGNIWEAEVDTLRQRLNRWNPQEAMVFRQYLADAETFSLDANGRFLIPKRLLKIAEIERELTFVGVDDRIEIWSKTRAEQPFMSQNELSEALQKLVGGNII